MELKLTIFKSTGKYYTDESLSIATEVPFWDYKDYILAYFNGRYSGMYATGQYPNEVPFLVHL